MARAPSPAPDPAGDSLRSPVAAIDQFLAAYIRGLQLPPHLIAAIEYALLGGGKRLRPLLSWHCCAAVGGDAKASLGAGAAVELIHAFSLVHDDLPSMDDDDLRRGRPTLHIHAGEAMAILAGDAMLALAFGALGDHYPPALAGPLTAELVHGTTGMIAGQVYDTLGGFPEEATPADRVERIHTDKTAALIRAACRMGARVGLAATNPPAGRLTPAPADQILEGITLYAESIGLMFQIVDDLLDIEQDPKTTGKRTRKDQSAGKLTYPGVHGIQKAREHIERLRTTAVQALDRLGPAADPLRALADQLAHRDR